MIRAVIIWCTPGPCRQRLLISRVSAESSERREGISPEGCHSPSPAAVHCFPKTGLGKAALASDTGQFGAGSTETESASSQRSGSSGEVLGQYLKCLGSTWHNGDPTVLWEPDVLWQQCPRCHHLRWLQPGGPQGVPGCHLPGSSPHLGWGLARPDLLAPLWSTLPCASGAPKPSSASHPLAAALPPPCCHSVT